MKRIILPAAILLAATLTANAQDAAAPRDGSRIIHRIEQRLNATEAQRQQVKAILQQERPTLMQLHTQLAAERAEMLQSTTFNEAQTRAIAARYAETNTEALVERARLRSELFAVLTPEQQQRVEQLRARFSKVLDARLKTLGDSL